MAKIMITTMGEYSNYQVLAVLNWLSDDTPKAARDRYLQVALRDQNGELPWTEYSDFLGWLVTEGYAEELEADELYLGNWRLEPSVHGGQVYDSLSCQPLQREE